MKKIWLSLGALVMLLAAIATAAGCADPGNISISGMSSQQEGIWVNGSGEVQAVPDIFNLSLGVVAQDDAVEPARAAAAAAMDDVMAALDDLKIAEKDIQTQRFSIRQLTRWDNVKNESIVIGYEVSNILSVKVRDIDKAGEVIDDVVAAGGDLIRINSMGFAIDDDSQYRAEARAKAVADAIAKAEQLADLAGVRLGNLTYITESYYAPAPVYRGYDAVAEGAATQISPGETTVSATVQLIYAIVP